MKEIKIRFEGLDSTFPGLLDQSAFLIEILKTKYDVIILKDGDEEPDVLFYSWLNMSHLQWHKCIRIYISMEMDFPDFNLCDYAIGMVNIDVADRYLYLPSFVYYNYLLKKYEEQKKILNYKASVERGFCSIVLSNYKYRNQIFNRIYQELNNYKIIASGGKWKNNVGGPVKDKLSFIKKYKFNLAIENTDLDGYVTEKIMESFVANSIPIYWGSKTVKSLFKEGGYIDFRDYTSIESAINYIKKVDADDKLYLKILSTGPRISISYDEWCFRLQHFLINAIEKGKYLSNFELYNIIHKEHFLVYSIRNKIPIKIWRALIKYYYHFSSLKFF